MDLSLNITGGFPDYSLIDSGGGYRLERFKDIVVAKPDPQAIWKRRTKLWDKADLIFNKETNAWEKRSEVPDSWNLKWGNLKFKVKPTPFKHLGIFPEQSDHWDFIKRKIEHEEREKKVLNLFGYTGAASVVSEAFGGLVTRVDASKPALIWVKENEKLNNLSGEIRVINDDCLKFTGREIKRGAKYDLILADPPAFGHGAQNETWKFNEGFPKLLANVINLLSDEPIGILINAYAISSPSTMLLNTLRDYLSGGKVTYGELLLSEETGRNFSTGIYARWEPNT